MSNHETQMARLVRAMLDVSAALRDEKDAFLRVRYATRERQLAEDIQRCWEATPNGLRSELTAGWYLKAADVLGKEAANV